MKKQKNTPKVEPKAEKKITLNRENVTKQLLKDDTSNWIVEKGVKMIEEGKTPGRCMLNFLEHLKLID